MPQTFLACVNATAGYTLEYDVLTLGAINNIAARRKWAPRLTEEAVERSRQLPGKNAFHITVVFDGAAVRTI